MIGRRSRSTSRPKGMTGSCVDVDNCLRVGRQRRRRSRLRGHCARPRSSASNRHGQTRLFDDDVQPTVRVDSRPDGERVSSHPASGLGGTRTGAPMRVITVEEHFLSPAVKAATAALGLQDLGGGGPYDPIAAAMPALEDLGVERLATMDRAGIDVQVVSHTVPWPRAVRSGRSRAVGSCDERHARCCRGETPRSPCRLRSTADRGTAGGRGRASSNRDRTRLPWRDDQWPHQRALSRSALLLADPGDGRTARCTDLPASEGPSGSGVLGVLRRSPAGGRACPFDWCLGLACGHRDASHAHDRRSCRSTSSLAFR